MFTRPICLGSHQCGYTVFKDERLYDVTKGMSVDKDVNRYKDWAQGSCSV